MSTALIVMLLGTLRTAPAAAQMAPPARSVTRPAPRASRLVPFAVATTAFDSNINHDDDDVDAYGLVVGGGVTFRSRPVKPAFEIQYQAGLHRYARTNRWNRLSHHVRTQWSTRMTRRLAFDAVGEASIKGSTEDQELSNQLAVTPRLEVRLTPAFRARGYGTLRLKRYDDDPARDAFNRYVGGELLGRQDGGSRWTAGARYEWNGATSARQQYLRWTLYTEYVRPIGPRDRLEVETRFRIQDYPFRLVDVPRAADVPRHDRRLEPSVAWTHVLDGDMELRASYGFNGRDSNDPRRDYRSHNLAFTILQRW